MISPRPRRHPAARSRLPLLAVLVLTLAALASGCAATVGDGCTSNRECATGQECDTASPGGYCTILSCRANSCPSEARCASVSFLDRVRTYCLRRCDGDGDCRGGYVCRKDLGTTGGVCYVAPAP